MLFYSFFKSLVGKDVVVELKNDLSICGTLHSVDQYLNIKLTDISVTDPEKHPHMSSVKSSFIRGSVVRYVQLPADEVDTQLLQDATRKEFVQTKFIITYPLNTTNKWCLASLSHLIGKMSLIRLP